MPDTKISALGSGGSAAAGDAFVVARSGNNYQIDATNVAAAATSVGTLASLAVNGVITGSAGTAASPALIPSGDTNTGLFFPAADTVGIATGGSERLQVDANGNMGLGVTPKSDWNSSQKALQIGTRAVLYGNANFTRLSNNGYIAGAGATETYIDTAAAALYLQNTGEHKWFTAPSGTGGTALTWTQRMVLDNNGNVGLGEASVADYRLVVKSADSTATTYALMTRNSSSTNLLLVRSDGYFVTGTAANSPYNYTSGSAANVYVDSGGSLARSTSSLRYKSNVQDATFGLAEVLALRPVTYRAKNSGDTVFGGLIAEEVDAAGLTPFVAYDEQGRPDAIHYGNMVALLVNAIKELNTRLTALEA